ncbi:MAG: hypothetical protein E7348_03645 [Clostridiales bacterium]|nr:hypothetical protein [Clostridiales bacterium]
MTNEKTKKMIVAGTVGAVLLLVTLLAIMIYQMVAIQKKKADIARWEKATVELQQLIEDGEKTVEIRSMRDWIEREARRLNLVYPEK